MNYRHIELSTAEHKQLIALKDSSENSRVIERCHALLLSDKGYKIEQLSDIFEVRRDTIGDWFNRWEAHGIKGLLDAPKSGRPRTFNPSEEKKS